MVERHSNFLNRDNDPSSSFRPKQQHRGGVMKNLAIIDNQVWSAGAETLI